MIEATLDDPRQILAAQLNKAKGEAVAQMKAEGIEYDERMELLEEVTYPKPLEELLDAAFEVYVRTNPWAADAHLSPKSVVREMWERAFTFREFVNTYGLTRSEGAVLRYLSDAFKALRSGVPADARTEEVTDLVEWLGELVRQVDSSLLDEWEQLTSPDQPLDVPVAVPARPRPLTGNERAFTAMVRNALFRRVELFARRRWYDLGELDGGAGWDADRWETVVRAYFAEHDEVQTGADARGPALLIVDKARARRLAGAADPRRPGRRPRLGLRRRGRPGGLRRGGHRRAPARRRRPQGLSVELRHVTTARLRLDAVVPDDLDEHYALLSDPAVWAHLARRAGTPRRSGRRRPSSTPSATGNATGWATGRRGCSSTWPAPRCAPGTWWAPAAAPLRVGTAWWNLYYRFTPAAWGHGLAAELVDAALDAARQSTPDRPVVACLLEPNVQSRGRAERAGLSLVWRGPDAGNPDPAAVRLVYADRPLPDALLARVTAHP